MSGGFIRVAAWRGWRSGVAGLFALAVLSGGVASAGAEGVGSTTTGSHVRIEVRYPGQYLVSGEDLERAGVVLDRVRAAGLRLTCDRNQVPLLVEGADDGRLWTTSTLRFIGDSPRGTATWLRVANKRNVYVLRWDGEAAGTDDRRSGTGDSNSGSSDGVMQVKPAPRAAAGAVASTFWQWRHVEKNYQHWFSTLNLDVTDNFYWFPFFASSRPEEALQTFVDFSGFDAAAGRPAEICLHVLGATNAVDAKPSHRFNVLYDGRTLGEMAFDGIAMHDACFTVAPGEVRGKPARVTFEAPAGREQVVDKIYLDWMTLRYPSRMDAGGAELWTANNDLVTTAADAGDDAATDTLTMVNLPAGGTIWDGAAGTAWRLAEDQTAAAIPNRAELTTFTVTAPAEPMRPDRVEYLDRVTSAAELSSGVQVLVVYHPALRQTAETYMGYRRMQGWAAQAVSTSEIYDQLSCGFVSDGAIKDYLRAAREARPTLTHVVLLGDCYFDYREARSYDDAKQFETLVPIHWVYSPDVDWSGGYQDDNWYVSFENPLRPEMAIGRISVNSDAEGMEHLRKLVEYEMVGGSKRDGALMISSVEEQFQELVKQVGAEAADHFSTVTYLFPQAEKVGQEVERLRQEINGGKQLLYYLGHGGSLVWRVGPTDFAQQKDLFTPAEVGGLTNRGHYPIVVCASCYTTAFDQPQSIGEAFVNAREAGAIAVIGSPWKARVQDCHEFNRMLLEEYYDPAVKTLGEASLRAHRAFVSEGQEGAMYNSFTLLGDPCVKIWHGGKGDGVNGGREPAVVAAGQEAGVVRVTSDGRVEFPAWDGRGRVADVGASAGVTSGVVRLGMADFPGAKVYRGQVLLQEGKIASRKVELGAEATTLSLLMRGRAAAEVFPRVRVTAVTPDNNHHRLFEGYVGSASMVRMELGLSPWVRGKAVTVEVEMLNPGVSEEQRMVYLGGG